MIFLGVIIGVKKGVLQVQFKRCIIIVVKKILAFFERKKLRKKQQFRKLFRANLEKNPKRFAELLNEYLANTLLS